MTSRKTFISVSVLTVVALSTILCGTSHAQMATEIMPGVTYYSGPNGGTLGVEIMPGYRRYSGEVQGHSVEVMPGVRSYSLQPSDSYPSMEGGFSGMADGIFQDRQPIQRDTDIWSERTRLSGRQGR